MAIIYNHHEGSQATRPSAVDTTSSSSVVYLRKNIQQIEKEDPETKEIITLWGYDEAVISHEEYEELLTIAQEKARSDIDFMAIMLEVDLDE